jgi:hypothetical protein
MISKIEDLIRFATAILFLILVVSCSNENTNSQNSTKFINGLAPVDVYLNMEKQGFVTDKKLGSELGNSWISSRNYAGIDYKVETFSTNINTVERVRATAIVDVTQKEILATQQFFVFISSLQYENSDPNTAGQWVINNFDNDKASTVIGDAKFTMFAPSIGLRMLIIEKAK